METVFISSGDNLLTKGKAAQIRNRPGGTNRARRLARRRSLLTCWRHTCSCGYELRHVVASSRFVEAISKAIASKSVQQRQACRSDPFSRSEMDDYIDDTNVKGRAQGTPEVWITTPRQVQAMESQLEQQRFEAARLRISLGHGRKGAYLVTCPTMVGTDLAYVNHYPLYFLYGQRRQRRRQR